ncbi:MAG: LLM class F420-dependent oxidoreductase [Rhodospirillaceae bacterium]|nr:LLM class F420-dependent oxidoreductase [Rhodospirillaceae bacterium]MBT6139670.1 LLM class F420-dependent oxidoreductase [Rhodospirillaceae bacterium]
MQIGFGLPARGPITKQPDAMAKLVQRGEDLGFRCLSIPDHIVIPRDIEPVYPYSGTGEPPFPADGECLEQLTLMSYVAALTTKARLLTSVLVVPHRNPVHTAKTIATIDVLSGGRMTIGVGAGWMQEEFEAIGAEPFKERGAVTDEYIQVFKELWTNDDPTFDGKYVKFGHVKFEPKPVQRPHPPIWVGGESPAAQRRAAKLGDGWFPIGANPRFPLNTLPRYQTALDKLKGRLEEAGRAPNALHLGFWANWSYLESDKRTDEGGRHLMSGGAEAAIEDITGLRELGIDSFMFTLVNPEDLSASLDNMQRFAETVMAKV